MFGLSVGKIILLVLLALGVWMYFRYRARVRHIRQVLMEMHRQAEQAERAARESAPRDPVSLHACPVCGSYVSADAAPCGRPDCPQRR